MKILSDTLNIFHVWEDTQSLVKKSLKLTLVGWVHVRLAPWNWFKPSIKIFYWPFQGGASLLIFYVFALSCVCYVFVCVCLYVLCGHLLGKGWPLGSCLWCLLWVCHFPIGILGQVWLLDCINSWSLHPYLLYNWNLMIFNVIWPFGPSPGPQRAGPKKCAVTRPIHVSNSHTKFGWISSNGLGDSVTDGGDCNIHDAFIKKRGDKYKVPSSK